MNCAHSRDEWLCLQEKQGIFRSVFVYKISIPAFLLRKPAFLKK